MNAFPSKSLPKLKLHHSYSIKSWQLYCTVMGSFWGFFLSFFFWMNLFNTVVVPPPTRKINLVAVSRLHLPQMTGLFFRLIAIFHSILFFYFYSNAEKCSLISDGLISLCNSSFIQSSWQSSRTVAPMTVCLTGSPPQSPLCKPRAAPHTPSVLNHVTGWHKPNHGKLLLTASFLYHEPLCMLLSRSSPDVSWRFIHTFFY